MAWWRVITVIMIVHAGAGVLAIIADNSPERIVMAWMTQ